MGGRSAAHLVLATAVAVVGVYDLALLGPATSWLKAKLTDFGDALPAPTQFFFDAQWFLIGSVGVAHAFVMWGSKHRAGVAVCLATIVGSVLLTAFWAFAIQLPFFAIAGAIK